MASGEEEDEQDGGNSVATLDDLGCSGQEPKRSLAGPSPTSTAEIPRRSSRPAAEAQANKSLIALWTRPASREDDGEVDREEVERSERAIFADEEEKAETLSLPPNSACVFPPPRGP